LEPIIEEQIRSWGIAVEGKELFTLQGEYSASMIRSALTQEDTESETPASLPVRPPVMCPGCPHRGVYYAMNRLKLGAMGDIGCYTLGALPPLSAIESCVCMGASIGMAHGMDKAREAGQSDKMVAVIGDSTFFHSGITGLIDVVYNSGCSTVLILDNRTTGMTGHQNHPGTGKNIKGDAAPMIDIEALARSIGVTDIQTVDPFDIEGTMAALKKAVQTKAPSVVISKRACALLDRKKNVTPFAIDTEKCTQCGMCLRLGCPAIQKKGDKMMIDMSLCVACGLCASVCRFDAIGGETHE
jgi:indolepyruvate ferredoxin oxidoreductase alpha subunit